MLLVIFIHFIIALSPTYAIDSTLWSREYGSRADMAFSGITSFAHLPIVPCLASKESFDIAIIGYPFDTAVSFRPGARFGPHGVRDGSRRLRPSNGWSLHWKLNPYDGATTIVDCGDVRILLVRGVYSSVI